MILKPRAALKIGMRLDMKTNEVLKAINAATGRKYTRQAIIKMRQRELLQAVKVGNEWHFIHSSVERVIDLCTRPPGWLTFAEIAEQTGKSEYIVAEYFDQNPPNILHYDLYLDYKHHTASIVVSPELVLQFKSAKIWEAPAGALIKKCINDIHPAATLSAVAKYLGVELSYLSRCINSHVNMSREVWIKLLDLVDDVEAGTIQRSQFLDNRIRKRGIKYD